jgi:predicted lipid-binding transport protein (Tim44 family)
VRFSGLIREDGAAEPQPFSEIWHLEKPMRGSAGWQVSGIQQG